MTPLRVAVFLLLGSTLAAAPAERAPATAHAFYVAYAGGDEAAVRAMWADGAPVELRRRTSATMRTRCLRLLAFDATPTHMTADSARVSVHALLARRPPRGMETLETHDAILTLTRDGGDWRIAVWTLREEALADAIVAAPDDRAREDVAASAEPTALLNRLLAKRALDLSNNRDPDRAAALVRLMKRMAGDIGDVTGESFAYSLESILLRTARDTNQLAVRSQFLASVEAGETAVALARQSGDPDALAKALLRLGRAEQELSPVDARPDRFEQVLALDGELEDPVPIATAVSQLAAYYGNRSDHRRALYYGDLARVKAEQNGDSRGLFNAETNLAFEYQYDGDFELAVEHFGRALAAARASELRSGEIWSLVNLATNQQRLGRVDAFRKSRAEVLRLADPEEDAEFLVDLHISDAMHAAVRGELAAAEEAARKSIASARSDGTRYRSWLTLARVQLKQRKPHAALESLARAAANQLEGDRYGPAVERAEGLRQLGRIEEATATLREELANIERSRATIVADDRQRRFFFKERMPTYLALVDLLVAQGKGEEALSVADETKGRALLDILSGAQVGLSAMTEQEQRTERELAARAAGISAARDPAARAELERNRGLLDSFRAEMRARHPLPASTAIPVPLTSAELNALLPDRKTAFVEYVLTGARVHIFVVRRGTAGPVIRVHTVAAPRSRIEQQSRRFATAVGSGNLRYGTQARTLYDELLAPIEQDLRGVTTICIVPDGALWHVPFEALLAPNGSFLASRVATFYAPSVAVYRAMLRGRPARDPKRPPSLLAFANPPLPKRAGAERVAVREFELTPLPDAEREVAAAAAFCSRPAVYVGRDALETHAKRESNQYDVIHFATHGLIDDANPMYSHLLLARGGGDDGLLETWEMMRLELRADLVVLSACDTARGEVGAGEGLVGMAWALFAAGCPSTIATQWKVESATAADLMIAFYREWRRPAGRGAFAKADALKRARAAIRNDPRRQHPFFWASHALIGLGD
jgi:CHAT domain-containing protein